MEFFDISKVRKTLQRCKPLHTFYLCRMNFENLPKYAGRVEMAKIAGISPRTLDYWRAKGIATKWHIHGANRVVFDVAATLREIGPAPDQQTEKKGDI